MNFLEQVREKRKNLKDVLFDEDYSGLREFLEELYPDSAHFIYELLQNAEDAGATHAGFVLESDQLVFEHNGRAFDDNDIWAITNIGKGTKKNDPDKIGKFGIGFKAVFGYTETPRIWSPGYSFEIQSLVLPYELTKKAELGKTTRFEFPFDSEKKPAEQAYAEIKAGLNEISPTTLLFLRKISHITWKTDADSNTELSRKEISEHHVQIVRKAENNRSCFEFLRFTAPVEGLTNQYVAIAFELEKVKAPKKQKPQKKGAMSQNYKIVPANPGMVAIYFPAKKEVSGLRFHIHAPFVPELSRASIKDTPVNNPLYEQISELASESLNKIKGMGLLTTDFLGTLPNSHDNISSHYQNIRRWIQFSMKQNPLVPTNSGSYAPADRLIQGRASYKKLFTNSDLKAFFPEKDQPLAWVLSSILKNSNSDRFLVDLSLSELDFNTIFKILNTSVEENNYYHFWTDEARAFQNWLFSKPPEWFQKLYAILIKENEREVGIRPFKNLKIVCLQNGEFSTPEKCYFPGSDGLEDSQFQRVNPKCFSSGKDKEEQDGAKRFLRAIGVRDVGEKDYVTAILKSRYFDEHINVSDEIHFQDIEKFCKFLEHNPGQTELFKDYRFLKSAENTWEKPGQLYIDTPLLLTGLQAYYEPMSIDSSSKRILTANIYQKCRIPNDQLIRFLENVGVATNLMLKRGWCGSNPNWHYLRKAPGQRRYSSEVDCDYSIPELADLLREPFEELCRLVWKTVMNSPIECLKAIYRKNASSEVRSSDSSIVCLLKETPWVPQTDGSFVTPANACSSLLPGGFPYDRNNEWLKAINFGEDNFDSNSFCEDAEAAVKLLQKGGVPIKTPEDLRRVQEFSQLPKNEQENLLRSRRNSHHIDLPDREPVNPERRGIKVFEQAMSAGSRETEQRTRSVDVHLQAVKAEAQEYLRQYYTNEDGQMICQICQAELPFKLANDEYYFESIKFLPGLLRQHHQNYLALCPNHAAMYSLINNSEDSMVDKLANIKGNEIEISLGKESATIYLNTTHIQDLKKVLQAEALLNPVDGNNQQATSLQQVEAAE